MTCLRWLITCALLLATAGVVEARDGGIDYWILGQDGRQIRAVQGASGDLVDGARLRFYRPSRSKLTAYSLQTGLPYWEVPFYGELGPQYRGWLSGKVLVILMAPMLVGFDVETGKRRYGVDARGLQPMMAHAEGRRYLKDIGDALYLVKSTPKHVRKADGTWGRSEATAPSELLRFDPRTGRVTWRSAVRFADPKEEVRAVSPGVVVGQQGGIALFHPRTGAFSSPLTARVQSEWLADDAQFLLTKGPSPRLMRRPRHPGGTRWSIPWPAGDHRIVARRFPWLWIAGDRHLFELDERDGRLLSKLAQTEMLVDVWEPRVLPKGVLRLVETAPTIATRAVRAVDLSTGTTRWERPGTGLAIMDRSGAVLVSPRADIQRPAWAGATDAAPALIAVSPKDGRLRWRWPVPGPPGGHADSATVRAWRCYAGYLVTREWLVR